VGLDPLKRFCSERCQRAAECRRYRARRTESATCPHCGTTFERGTTTKRLKRFCSLECQYAARSADYQGRADIRANLKRAELIRRRKAKGQPPRAWFISGERLLPQPCGFEGHDAVVSPVPAVALLTQLRADVDSLSTQLRRCDQPGIRVKDLDHSPDRQMESWADHVPREVEEENAAARGRAHVPVG
jgi:hypothetical protein